MRIISDFRDYYDPVQATGQDQTLLYMRSRKELPDPGGFPKFGWYADYLLARYNATVCSRIIGFCGRIHPLVEFSFRQLNGGQAKHYCYSIDEVDSIVKQSFKRLVEGYFAKKRGKYWRVGGLSRRWIVMFFAECDEKRQEFDNIFHANRCPIFVKSRTIVLNEQLKQFEFFRVVDTYQAFQEIAAYLGGVAQPERQIPKIADEDMVGIKGFDKWSFRKLPRKRR